jgi:AraC family transcriptional activator of pobA
MKENIIFQWINDKSIANRQVEILAANDKMTILKAQGENVICPDLLEESHPTFLFLSKGKLNFWMNGDYIEIQAPSHIDFILIYPWKKIKTSKDFEGYFVTTEQSFFIKVSASIRSKFGGLIYQYAQKPFVPLNEETIQRIILFLHLLIAIIKQPEYHFRYEVMENMLRTLQLEIWNIVFNLYKNEVVDEQQLWSDILSHFLHLVRTNCRYHHEVKWYANQLCVSSDALSARARRTYDKSAGQIIDEYLMIEAKAYLQNPSQSIQNIAELLCFSDQASFCKFFKRCCGISPSEFKKAQGLTMRT